MSEAKDPISEKICMRCRGDDGRFCEDASRRQSAGIGHSSAHADRLNSVFFVTASMSGTIIGPSARSMPADWSTSCASARSLGGAQCPYRWRRVVGVISANEIFRLPATARRLGGAKWRDAGAFPHGPGVRADADVAEAAGSGCSAHPIAACCRADGEYRRKGDYPISANDVASVVAALKRRVCGTDRSRCRRLWPPEATLEECVMSSVVVATPERPACLWCRMLRVLKDLVHDTLSS